MKDDFDDKAAPHNGKNLLGEQLITAINTGDHGEVVSLLDKWADPAAYTDAEGHAIIAAVKQHNPEILKTLVEAGAPLNVRDRDGKTPLHVAVTYGNVDHVKTLVTKGAIVTIPCHEGRTALQRAEESYDYAYKMLENAAQSESATDFEQETVNRLDKITSLLKQYVNNAPDTTFDDGLLENIHIKSPLRLKKPGAT
ncbi:MAG: ankyrin repeat domain-containing protein [Alphaproteobacteria bacterium]